MKIYRIANLAVLSFVLSIGFAAAARADDKAVPGWDPAVFRDASTIKIMTTEPDVGEHWSNLWVVVIDGQPYVRLGDRAYGRIQKNTTSPYVKLKVADWEFDKVKVEEMPDMKEKVAAGMADKYWMDILIRHESHPMVARLVPEAPPFELSRVHLAKGLARPPQISKVRRNDRSRAARIDNLGDHGFAPVGGVGDDEVKVVIRLVSNLKKHGADRVCGQLDRRGAPIVRQEGRSRQSVQGDYRRGHRLEINAVAVLV